MFSVHLRKHFKFLLLRLKVVKALLSQPCELYFQILVHLLFQIPQVSVLGESQLHQVFVQLILLLTLPFLFQLLHLCHSLVLHVSDCLLFFLL